MRILVNGTQLVVFAKLVNNPVTEIKNENNTILYCTIFYQLLVNKTMSDMNYRQLYANYIYFVHRAF